MITKEATHKAKTETLKEKAYGMIKEKIITCQFTPGEFINETALSDELGVSRTPIREALNRLERENLVRIFPKKGLLVTDISIVDINEIYQVRELLEPYIIRLYGKDVNKKVLMDIRGLLLEKSAQDNEDEKYKIDSDLHRVLLSSNRNRYFSLAIENVYDQNQRVRVMSARRIQDRLKETTREHIAIIELILTDDYGAAAEAMLAHLRNSRDAAVRSMLW